MKCSICSLIIDQDKVITINNNIFCIQCNDINTFAESINEEIIIKTPIIDNNLKQKIENYIKCPKCKNKFSTKKCVCGYINPLYKF
jgi:hypothetical protein